MTSVYDVAIVGGGPAGAATAIGLTRRGYDVAVLERQRGPTWRACGVFATPLVRDRLASLGVSATQLGALHRPIQRMHLTSTRGAWCTLDYAGDFACGFDRVQLDETLLCLAASAGADVRRATVVRTVTLDDKRHGTLSCSALDAADDPFEIAARIVVGADGGGSRVARPAAVHSARNWLGRAAITFHAASTAQDAQFILGRGWYVGLAPVPPDRVNVGIVVPAKRLADGVASVIAATAGRVEPIDEPQICGRLEHHTSRAAGQGWLLVGDAIEFIDPLTGEGLHRALVTADLASEAIHRSLAGDSNALADYDRRVRSRFRSKNVFSLVLQAFVGKPVILDYALSRLDARPALRDELTSVLSDREPATTALDPRFMARLLRP